MRHRIYGQRESQDAFPDLLFNALLGFAFMFVVAFSLISDPTDTGKVDRKAEILITVRWQDRHPDDVDTQVEDPQGNMVWYHIRDTGLMHLARDDRGLFQDRVILDGVEVSNPLNQETVTVRAMKAGEYVVNVLHYQANYSEPLPVTVKVEKLNPVVKLIHYEKLELNGIGDEQTAVRFTVDGSGEVIGTNKLSKRLLSKAVAVKL